MTRWNGATGRPCPQVVNTTRRPFRGERLRGSVKVNQMLDDGNSTYDLLSHRYRCHVLDLLTEADRSHSLTEMATAIADRERDASADGARTRTDGIRIALYHNHLPRLADSGLIAFERDRKTARLDRPSDRVDRFLSAA